MEKKTPRKKSNPLKAATEKGDLSYPVRIFFDEYTKFKEESAAAYTRTPSGEMFETNSSIWNVSTGESLLLTEEKQITEEDPTIHTFKIFLYEDSRVFYSYNRKRFFIFTGKSGGWIYRLNSETSEIVDRFEFYVPARTPEGKDEEKERIQREGRASLYGTNLKPVGEKIVGTRDARFLVYDQRRHNIQKVDEYVQAYCKLNDNEILFATTVFTSQATPTGASHRAERVLNSMNLVTNEVTRIGSLHTLFPPNVVISDMDLVGDIVFFRSHNLKGMKETDHTTTLWSLTKRKKVRSFKFETFYIFGILGKKAFLHYFSEEKGYSIGVVSLNGKILRSRKVYKGNVSQCLDGNFAFASGDPKITEFRIYNEKLNVIFRKNLGWSERPILCLDPTTEDKKKLSAKLNGLMGGKIPKVLVDIIQGFF